MASRRVWAFACLLFLGTFAVYIKTFCSSLYPDDSGETATLAYTLGIGHPPGYPLHTLISRIFVLLPLGDPALRINLLAACLGALCAPVAWLLLRRQAGNGPALVAALLIGLGGAFWHNAGVAKGSVYMLNNVLSLALLWVLSGLEGPKRDRLFFLLLGLGLAHHYMSQAVLLPCYAALLYGPDWRRRLMHALWILPGLSLYAFLFIRSAQGPAVNWGEIRTWGDFVFFLSRAQYAASEFSRTFATSFKELQAALAYLAKESWGLGMALAAFGAIAARGRFRLALVLGLAAPLAAVTVYLNLQGERLSIMQPYLFPAYLCQAGLAALGLRWLGGKLKAGWDLSWLAALLLIPAALRGYASNDKSSYFFATDNARNLLQCLPRQAVLFSSGDAIIFPLWYLQDVKGERRDVALVGTPVLPMPWVRHALARRYPHLRQPFISGPIGVESVDRLAWILLELNQGLPLYFSYNHMNAGIPKWRLVPQGPVYRALPELAPDPPAAKAKAEAALEACVTRGYLQAHLDERTEKLIIGDQAIHHNSLGTWLEDRKDYSGALKHFSRAALLHPSSEDFPFNVGNALHELGRKEEAIAWYKRSLAINPLYEGAWFNLAVTEFMLNHDAEGCAALQKTLQINPSNATALAQKGRCPNLQ